MVGLNGLASAFCASLLLTCVTSDASTKRFFPEELLQDTKVTLTPSFTPDGKQIFFSQSECSPIWECPQRLKTSYLTKDGWTAPELVSLPTNDRVDWPNVSADGRYLVFSWAAPRDKYKGLDIYENFDLYRLDLTRQNAFPEPIEGADINRPRSGKLKKLRFVHNETYANITLNGDLYFMTERLDGVGDRDIYVAKATGSGYDTARPLPAPINSKQQDDGVWINPEGDLMLLSYNARGGEGDADLFVSVKINDNWQSPINLGSSVNTQFAEFGPKLSPDGKQLLFTSNRPVEDNPAGLLQVWVTDFDKNLYF